MNRTIIKGLLFSAVLLGIAAPIALGATAADAAPANKVVVAKTHVAGVPDTTVGSTATGVYEDANGQPVTDPAFSVYGPVWAIDEITNTFRVTPLGNNKYQVDRIANGTYVGFAQPNTGSSTITSLNGVSGQIHGTNSYTVYSVNAPNTANLLPEQATATGTYAELKQLFSGLHDSDISGGGTWVFAYVADGGGSRMVQSWNTDPSTWGNITG